MVQQLTQSLSGVELMLGRIYNEHDRQFYPSVQDMALKLIWSFGLFSSAERKGEGDKILEYLADCFAWWIAECNFCEFRAEDVLWDKFPGICPYCGAEEDCGCEGRKDLVRIPESEVQRHRKKGTRPRTIAQWQAMFERIYGKANALRGYHFAVARLPEEFKELVECLLPWIEDRRELKMELADIGARILAIANLLKVDFQQVFLSRYPGRCPGCQKSKCGCDQKKGRPA